MMARTSPLRTSKETESRTLCAPKNFDTDEARIITGRSFIDLVPVFQLFEHQHDHHGEREIDACGDNKRDDVLKSRAKISFAERRIMLSPITTTRAVSLTRFIASLQVEESYGGQPGE